jgi:hypothetical protein
VVPGAHRSRASGRGLGGPGESARVIDSYSVLKPKPASRHSSHTHWGRGGMGERSGQHPGFYLSANGGRDHPSFLSHNLHSKGHYWSSA